MLQEQDRQKLDGIVQQMIKNKESDKNIQFVVNDFTQKYTKPSAQVLKPSMGLTEKIASTPYNLGVGALKGVASTVSGMSNLGEKILANTVGKGVNALTGKNVRPSMAQIPSSWTTPSNTTQSVGKGVEQVAEFFIPGGATSKLTKGAGLLTKVAVGAGEMGGMTALQTGNLDKNTGQAAIIGGALPIAGAVINKIIQKIPETSWSSLLKRTPSESLKNPKLSDQASKTGLTGWTRESLSQQAGNAIQKIEMNLDDILTGPTPSQLKKFDTITGNKSDIINKGKALIEPYSKIKGSENISTVKVASYLDDLKTAYSHIPGEQGSVDAINTIIKDLIKKPTLTPLEANQLKRDIYQHIAKSYGKGTMEIPVKTEAQKQIARGLKSEIEKIIPEVKSLNEKQAVYIQVKKALDKTIARVEGKGIAGTGVGLYDLIGGGLLAGTGVVPTIPVIAGIAVKRIAGIKVATGVSKMITAFNEMSPTKKLMFYTAIKGLISEVNKK